MNVYGVYLCGPTDCFLSAVFLDREYAGKWAAVANTNPEGFVVKDLTPSQLAKELEELNV